MNEKEAMNKIQELIMKRRKYLGISDHSYCTKCKKVDARYLTFSVVDGSTECEECYAKRVYDELIPQIEEIKKEKAKNVKEYFTKKRLQLSQKECIL